MRKIKEVLRLRQSPGTIANLEPVSRTFIEISLFPSTFTRPTPSTGRIIQKRLRCESVQFQVASSASYEKKRANPLGGS